MAKIKFNGLIDEVHGRVGDVVIRKYKNKTILSNRRGPNTNEPTEAQVAHNERFNKAVAFGKRVMADEALRPLYQETAKNKDIPIFALCIADYFNTPTMDTPNLSQYKGNVGDPILITTYDDVGVVDVDVAIFAGNGTAIEKGKAVEVGTGSGSWVYTATMPVVSGSNIIVDTQAVDRPGSRTVNSVNTVVG